jgi:hypothetical protein
MLLLLLILLLKKNTGGIDIRHCSYVYLLTD